VFEAVPEPRDVDRPLGETGRGRVRSEEVATKIALHLQRFRVFFAETYGHDRISTET
jgi:hypothetical protein